MYIYTVILLEHSVRKTFDREEFAIDYINSFFDYIIKTCKNEHYNESREQLLLKGWNEEGDIFIKTELEKHSIEYNEKTDII